jgi:hypothetical protein
LYHAVSKPPHKQRIGRLFLDFAEGFKSYTMYCSNHPNAIAAMYRLDKRRSWKAFLGNVCRTRQFESIAWVFLPPKTEQFAA